MNNTPYISINDVKKSYENGKIQALRGATLSITQGEFVAIMGPSGCGKSTLLHLIGGLDVPTEGEITVRGNRIVPEKDLTSFRARHVGFIFQLHNLIPALTAAENVQIPLMTLSLPRNERSERARKVLQLVGLEDRTDHIPSMLSGGERQRVAIARALVNKPDILIADEPTGSLDSKSAENILELLRSVHQKTSNTTVMVTHDAAVASYADRIIRMADGAVLS